MSLGIVGQKCGMTRIFKKNGDIIPVTVIHAEPNRITQVKTLNIDGYNSIQVTTGNKKRSKINKSELGHFLKAKVEPGVLLWEFSVNDEFIINYNKNKIEHIDISIFSIGQKVDVTGISKGKGFQGTVKRYNFKTQDASHGNSISHRVPGSVGQNQTPGRIFKNKKMPGQLGNKKVTVQKLEIINIDDKNNILLLKGCIPGSINKYIVISPSTKIS